MGRFFFNKKDVILQKHKIYAILKSLHTHRKKNKHSLPRALFILYRENILNKKTSFALCPVRQLIQSWLDTRGKKFQISKKPLKRRVLNKHFILS